MKIIYSPLEKLHNPAYEWNFGKLVQYPEKNIRAEVIRDEVAGRGMESMIIEPDEYDISNIKNVHDYGMVDHIKSCEELNDDEAVFPHVFPYRDYTPKFINHPRMNLKKSGYYCFDVGIEIEKNTFKSAKAAADSALTGADLIMSGEEKQAFALCRPPGHHAGYAFFGGYCIFCNAAIAAFKLMEMGKVAILDVDFHHGNGIQDIFYNIPNVLYVSLHGDPQVNYPYLSGFEDEVGERLGLGSNLNIPLKQGTGDKEYREYLKKAIKKIDSFKPDVLILSVGLDIYQEDPLSDIGVSSGFFKEIAQTMTGLGIPVLGLLEGGYDMRHLAENGANFIEGLAEA